MVKKYQWYKKMERSSLKMQKNILNLLKIIVVLKYLVFLQAQKEKILFYLENPFKKLINFAGSKFFDFATLSIAFCKFFKSFIFYLSNSFSTNFIFFA